MGVSGGLVRVRLTLAYDGAEFSGWATQPGRDTVAGQLERALGMVFRLDPPPRTVCAGRTDAGVHAVDQNVHFELPAEVWREHGPRIARRLNGVLPASIRVLRAATAEPGFDARFSVVSRRYGYRVSDAAEVNPLQRQLVLKWSRPLDLDRMNTACEVMLGEHDFAAFCKAREGASSVRRLIELGWTREPAWAAGDADVSGGVMGGQGATGVAKLTIAADAFCHSMVRAVVGALLVVGDGRRDRQWLARVLTDGVRTPEVVIAPAFPLVLERVEYAADLGAAAQRARRFRGARSRGATPPDLPSVEPNG